MRQVVAMHLQLQNLQQLPNLPAVGKQLAKQGQALRRFLGSHSLELAM